MELAAGSTTDVIAAGFSPAVGVEEAEAVEAVAVVAETDGDGDGGGGDAGVMLAQEAAVTDEDEHAKKKRRSVGSRVPRWSDEEEGRLKDLVEALGVRSWRQIAEQLGTGRSASGVDQHWQIMSGRRKRSGKTEGSDKLVASPTRPGVEVLGVDHEAASGREGAAVATPMTAEVVAIVGGDGGQPALAQAVAAEGQKGEKGRRERRSSGKVQRWTEEEEQMLKKLVSEMGTTGTWNTIAQQLGTGRSPAGVDQHWQIMTGRRKRGLHSASASRASADAVADAVTVTDATDATEGTDATEATDADADAVVAVNAFASGDIPVTNAQVITSGVEVQQLDPVEVVAEVTDEPVNGLNH